MKERLLHWFVYETLLCSLFSRPCHQEGTRKREYHEWTNVSHSRRVGQYRHTYDDGDHDVASLVLCIVTHNGNTSNGIPMKIPFPMEKSSAQEFVIKDARRKSNQWCILLFNSESCSWRELYYFLPESSFLLLFNTPYRVRSYGTTGYTWVSQGCGWTIRPNSTKLCLKFGTPM